MLIRNGASGMGESVRVDSVKAGGSLSQQATIAALKLLHYETGSGSSRPFLTALQWMVT